MRGIVVLLSILLSVVPLRLSADERADTSLLSRLFGYAEKTRRTVRPAIDGYAYSRSYVDVRRRNFLLPAIPSLFFIARGDQRRFLSETYDSVRIDSMGRMTVGRLLTATTIPHRQRTFPTLLAYLTPRLYDPTMIGDNLLSPFHRQNRRFYRYRSEEGNDSVSWLVFRPKLVHTQLVRGRALVDRRTGRLLSGEISGEYDMVSFIIRFDMGREGPETLHVRSIDLRGTFRFMGNKIDIDHHVIYHLDRPLAGDYADEKPFVAMAAVRPYDLSVRDSLLLGRELLTPRALSPPAQPRVPTRLERLADRIWDGAVNHLVNSVKASFGKEDRGHFRLDPVLNPLYMGYTGRKGITYKTALRADYDFSENSGISARLNAGYSFRLKQFYFSLPVNYVFDARRQGRLSFEVGNGNHISSPIIDRAVEESGLQDIASQHDVSHFRDLYSHGYVRYEPFPRLVAEVGVVYHHRRAVDRRGLSLLGLQTVYRSFAPSVQLRYRPFGDMGPVFTVGYERSFTHIFGSDIAYERWEGDGQWMLELSRLRVVSLRAGLGFYTQKNKVNYFLDYSNFRDNNIVGGWNDDWSGEFELLPSADYNLSPYYFRSNATYESPLLLLSHLPLIGRYIEAERFYGSILWVKDIHPYAECGYGLTTRWCSLALFMANREGRFTGWGVKFGFELFRHW